MNFCPFQSFKLKTYIGTSEKSPILPKDQKFLKKFFLAITCSAITLLQKEEKVLSDWYRTCSTSCEIA